MGRIGSSSSRKYPKKKSLKVSSEGYRKKKSRSRSKKLRHHDDSPSSGSDDESTSSSLNSSSGSEGEYKRKRSRSRSRNESKGSKKRRRRRSLSEDSIKDSSPVKKRKRSKKSKKIKKKKKKSSKRYAYSSSASSDSGSCSTCKDEDSSIDELGSHGGSRGRSREKKKGHRDSTMGRTGNRKNRSKTRSSFSPSRSYGSESFEKVAMENNPMRLKSVITVANLEDEEEEDNTKINELKEETVYDYDDYPSSKSNDSTELVDRVDSSELADRINSSDNKSVVKEVTSGSNLNVSGNIGSEVDDLESILRQKALENLSRFRGGIKTKPAVPVDDKPRNDQSVVMQPTRESVSMTPASEPVTHRSRFTWRRDHSVTKEEDEKAATYNAPHSSGSQPPEVNLQSSKIMFNTSNADQKTTAVVKTQTPSSASIQEGSSKEQQNEGNDNSQFEKKTMSVMRGGEMVQVSYKVYIPNRAPALARRQLKR